MKVTGITINAERHLITLEYEDGTYWNEVTTAIKEGETFEDFHYNMEGTGDINVWLDGINISLDGRDKQIKAYINGYGVPLTIVLPK